MASVNIADDEQRIVIRTLNDQFRKTGIGGSIFVTKGVEYLSEDTKQKIIEAVRALMILTTITTHMVSMIAPPLKLTGSGYFGKLITMIGR